MGRHLRLVAGLARTYGSQSFSVSLEPLAFNRKPLHDVVEERPGWIYHPAAELVEEQVVIEAPPVRATMTTPSCSSPVRVGPGAGVPKCRSSGWRRCGPPGTRSLAGGGCGASRCRPSRRSGGRPCAHSQDVRLRFRVRPRHPPHQGHTQSPATNAVAPGIARASSSLTRVSKAFVRQTYVAALRPRLPSPWASDLSSCVRAFRNESSI